MPLISDCACAATTLAKFAGGMGRSALSPPSAKSSAQSSRFCSRICSAQGEHNLMCCSNCVRAAWSSSPSRKAAISSLLHAEMFSTTLVTKILFPSNARDASLQKLLAHYLSRAEETILDRAQWQRRHFSNLVITEIVRVAQHDQLPVGGRQLVNHRFDFRSPLPALALLFGRRLTALD